MRENAGRFLVKFLFLLTDTKMRCMIKNVFKKRKHEHKIVLVHIIFLNKVKKIFSVLFRMINVHKLFDVFEKSLL